ncbi:flagellar export chaperone FliS [Fontimonas sp. SYSU GA230001]|uniref:flagellar export chaperone FliS n=1 Tax=Fontimonas sp. SYSU GA230001 TaxID=3142450 RepID=UPI0032B3EB77
MSHSALSEYRNTSVFGAAEAASPHKLIEMLYAGLLERLATARGAIGRGDTAGKAKALSSALDIVQHLKLNLDQDKGGAIARNLGALYDYLSTRLLHANLKSDVAALDEMIDLVRRLKSAWDAMPAPH